MAAAFAGEEAMHLDLKALTIMQAAAEVCTTAGLVALCVRRVEPEARVWPSQRIITVRAGRF